MQNIYGVLVGLLLTVSSYGQFGITGGTAFTDNEEWGQIIQTFGETPTGDFSNRGWAVGVDYWFRLKNLRVEFLPEARLSRTVSRFDTENNGNFSVDLNRFYFNFNTHIYPFDFKGDCDCPTWSKEGPTLKKGLFIRLSPGAMYRSATDGVELDTPGYTSALRMTMGAGLGFDIGISDFLTITPLAEHRWYQGEDLQTVDAATLTGWFAGVRLGIRLDD